MLATRVHRAARDVAAHEPLRDASGLPPDPSLDYVMSASDAVDLEAMLRRGDDRGPAAELTDSAWTLAATCCAHDAGLLDFLDEPRTPDEIRAHVGHLPASLVDALVEILVVTGSVARDGGGVRVTERVRRLTGSPRG